MGPRGAAEGAFPLSLHREMTPECRQGPQGLRTQRGWPRLWRGVTLGTRSAAAGGTPRGQGPPAGRGHGDSDGDCAGAIGPGVALCHCPVTLSYRGRDRGDSRGGTEGWQRGWLGRGGLRGVPSVPSCPSCPPCQGQVTLLMLALSPSVSPTLDREGTLGVLGRVPGRGCWGQSGGLGDSQVALGTV